MYAELEVKSLEDSLNRLHAQPAQVCGIHTSGVIVLFLFSDQTRRNCEEH